MGLIPGWEKLLSRRKYFLLFISVSNLTPEINYIYLMITVESPQSLLFGWIFVDEKDCFVKTKMRLFSPSCIVSPGISTVSFCNVSTIHQYPVCIVCESFKQVANIITIPNSNVLLFLISTLELFFFFCL
uniref:Uncharacterized protein n=1 Tax=Cacopsylla melanoneura TaxID=428564 RepID=A0A8D8ZSW4_9HEMI